MNYLSTGAGFLPSTVALFSDPVQNTQQIFQQVQRSTGSWTALDYTNARDVPWKPPTGEAGGEHLRSCVKIALIDKCKIWEFFRTFFFERQTMSFDSYLRCGFFGGKVDGTDHSMVSMG